MSGEMDALFLGSVKVVDLDCAKLYSKNAPKMKPESKTVIKFTLLISTCMTKLEKPKSQSQYSKSDKLSMRRSSENPNCT